MHGCDGLDWLCALLETPNGDAIEFCKIVLASRVSFCPYAKVCREFVVTATGRHNHTLACGLFADSGSVPINTWVYST